MTNLYSKEQNHIISLQYSSYNEINSYKYRYGWRDFMICKILNYTVHLIYWFTAIIKQSPCSKSTFPCPPCSLNWICSNYLNIIQLQLHLLKFNFTKRSLLVTWIFIHYSTQLCLISPISSAVNHSTVILKQRIKIIIYLQEILIRTYVFINSYKPIIQMQHSISLAVTNTNTGWPVSWGTSRASKMANQAIVQ
jgi:hypothetical protein